LLAAAKFCNLFGDDVRGNRYLTAAEKIKRGILHHLWDEETGRFVRGLYRKDGEWAKDRTLESSLYGVFEFGVLPADDERVMRTMQAIKEGLAVKTDVGGIARYRNDYYFQRSDDIDQVPGNPWIICTLWVAEWEIAKARTLEELESSRLCLEWAAGHAMESGMLPEQLDPFSGAPISVAPLTWSHATFILTVVKYMEKYRSLQNARRE